MKYYSWYISYIYLRSFKIVLDFKNFTKNFFLRAVEYLETFRIENKRKILIKVKKFNVTL